jgi:hypothetical protein
MIPAQRSRFESLAIEWGAAFDIRPDQVRALDDRRLTDLCRCFAVIAENKRKVAAIVAEKRLRRSKIGSPYDAPRLLQG